MFIIIHTGFIIVIFDCIFIMECQTCCVIQTIDIDSIRYMCCCCCRFFSFALCQLLIWLFAYQILIVSVPRRERLQKFLRLFSPLNIYIHQIAIANTSKTNSQTDLRWQSVNEFVWWQSECVRVWLICGAAHRERKPKTNLLFCKPIANVIRVLNVNWEIVKAKCSPLAPIAATKNLFISKSNEMIACEVIST